MQAGLAAPAAVRHEVRNPGAPRARTAPEGRRGPGPGDRGDAPHGREAGLDVGQARDVEDEAVVGEDRGTRPGRSRARAAERRAADVAPVREVHARAGRRADDLGRSAHDAAEEDEAARAASAGAVAAARTRDGAPGRGALAARSSARPASRGGGRCWRPPEIPSFRRRTTPRRTSARSTRGWHVAGRVVGR